MSYPVKKLWEIFDITSSKRVFKADWKSEWVPFYRAREIVKLAKNGYVDNDLFITEEMFNEYSEKYWVPKEWDIMVTWVWTLGVCHLVKKEDKFYFKDGNIIWFKHVWKEVDSRYIEYGFKSEFIKEQVSQTTGTSVWTYTIIRAKNTEIPLPPLPTQKAIVQKLDAVFEKLDASIELVKKNLESIEELWRSILDMTSQYEKIKIWEIVKELSAWWDLPKDKSFTKEKTEEYQIPIYANAVKEDGLYWYTHTAKVFEPAITISARWTIWFTKLRTEPFYPIVRLLVLIPKPEKATLQYLEYIINTIDLKQFWSSIPQLSVPQLKNFEIPLPPLSKQKEIVEHLDKVFTKNAKLKELYESKLRDLQEMKQSLLREAFEGKLVSE